MFVSNAVFTARPSVSKAFVELASAFGFRNVCTGSAIPRSAVVVGFSAHRES